jgi:hypothetical protein
MASISQDEISCRKISTRKPDPFIMINILKNIRKKGKRKNFPIVTYKPEINMIDSDFTFKSHTLCGCFTAADSNSLYKILNLYATEDSIDVEIFSKIRDILSDRFTIHTSWVDNDNQPTRGLRIHNENGALIQTIIAPPNPLLLKISNMIQLWNWLTPLRSNDPCCQH